MSAPLLLDLSHTSHTRARTGIQRVARALHTTLADRAIAITHDPFRGGWRRLERWEHANLNAARPAPGRGARWPLLARLRGRYARWTGGAGERAVAPLAAIEPGGLLVSELFSPAVAAALPDVFRITRGPAVALFHDAIALKLPELAPAKTVARFPGYLVELLGFDGIAAVSEDSRATLLSYWDWLGVTARPPVVTIPLGIDLAPRRDSAVITAAEANQLTPIVLCVGSLEGRKNHLALFDACAELWAKGASFALHVIGMARPETAGAAIARMRSLQSAGHPLRYDGAVGDEWLECAYAGAAFTVYPSVLEGFGLPVLESLAHGKPCVCSGRGALGESARGGGCATLEEMSAPALAATIGRLLSDPAELRRLSTEARQRTFRTWSDYAAELTGWMSTLPRRANP